MKRLAIVSGLTFSFLFLQAQNRTFTLSLYYALNESASDANFSRIDSLCSSVGTSSLSVRILGYADFLNTTAYNKQLSERRAQLVKDQLLKNKNAATISITECLGMGETYSQDNQNKTGEPSQRRVDLIVNQRSPVKKIGDRDNKIQEPVKKIETQPEPVTTETVAIPRPETPKKPGNKKGLEDLEKGESLSIEGLNFIPGRHVLVNSAIPVLENLLKTLKEHPGLKIEIQGHICCVDPEEQDGFDYDTHERNLSESRAEAIYNYLVKNGIDQSRLTYKGYGHRFPKVQKERSPADEQKNRRVEIKVLEN